MDDNTMGGPQTSQTPDPNAASIAREVTPNGAGYFIQVASLASPLRATRLVDELSKSGYSTRQREVDLGLRGRFHVVMVGSYETREEAEADLKQIRELAAYHDARIIEASPQTRLGLTP